MSFTTLKLCLRMTLPNERKRNYFNNVTDMKGIEVDKSLGALLINSLASQTALTQFHFFGRDDIIA